MIDLSLLKKGDTIRCASSGLSGRIVEIEYDNYDYLLHIDEKDCVRIAGPYTRSGLSKRNPAEDILYVDKAQPYNTISSSGNTAIVTNHEWSMGPPSTTSVLYSSLNTRPEHNWARLPENLPEVTLAEPQPEQPEEVKKDDVNHPPHYTHGKIEPINVICDWKLGFWLGNCIKYISRNEHKGNKIKDLKKARFYLDDYIKRLENGEDPK